ncbi:prepilin peptidase [Bacillus carboniphilus]|uniref:Prepilin peptidase n=1 Tax=Bacillus carboniphilus TaxID=86663 RepID=A0ABY9K2S2_9BACI|nr:A24 family peptidase [Bacillus carboniphilus]WLR44090.1 prepilin peptidase [Bacillus carboniphilus]
MIGLIIGSFVNVVGYRTVHHQSLIWPSSYCPQCQTPIKHIHKIPLVSFVLLKGKCSTCQFSISIRYPIVELLMGCLFVISPLVFGYTTNLLIAYTFYIFLFIVTVTDLIEMIIPNKVILLFFIIFLVEIMFFSDWLFSIVGLLVGFFLSFLIVVLSRGKMGMGDVKLLAIVGLVLGWKGMILSFFLANMLGTLFVFFMNPLYRNRPIPFAPFITAGSCVSILFDSQLISWYYTFL